MRKSHAVRNAALLVTTVILIAYAGRVHQSVLARSTRAQDAAYPPTGIADDRANPADLLQKLDREYQEAVKNNDAARMDRILADDFTLVTGSGKRYSKADLLAEARSGRYRYERQDDIDQSVRMWGDAGIVTAKLTAKGREDGKPFDYELWFSDIYMKTPSGWKYVFGQASLPLKKLKQ